MIDQKLEAIRRMMANPVLPKPKEPRKEKPAPVKKDHSASLMRLEATIEERRAERERIDQARRERAEKAANLVREKADKKRADKTLAAEQRRQPKANKERQKLLHDQEDKRRLPTRVVDYSTMKTCPINEKTVIYIPLDQDPEEARKNWLEKNAKLVVKKGDSPEMPPTYEF